MNPQDLNGENEQTPAGSLPEIQTPESGEPVNLQDAENFGSEEANWNSLSGPSKERFRQAYRKANEWQQKYEEVANQKTQTYIPPVTTPTIGDPNAENAVRVLSGIGIATRDEVDRKVKEEIQQSMGALAYKYELDRLEGKYDGGDGLPAFTREEYENYVGSHPEYRNYQPEDVYSKMFSNEILDHKVQNYGKTLLQRQSPSLRPTKTQVKEEQWTPEAIDARLREPDGPEWYDKNQSLVRTVMAKSASGQY